MASSQWPVFFSRKNTPLMVKVSSLLLACLSVSFNLLLTLSIYSLFTHWPAIPNYLQVLLLLVCFTLSGLCSVFYLFSLSPVLSSSQGCIPVVNATWPRQLAYISVSLGFQGLCCHHLLVLLGPCMQSCFVKSSRCGFLIKLLVSFSTSRSFVHPWFSGHWMLNNHLLEDIHIQCFGS